MRGWHQEGKTQLLQKFQPLKRDDVHHGDLSHPAETVEEPAHGIATFLQGYADLRRVGV